MDFSTSVQAAPPPLPARYATGPLLQGLRAFVKLCKSLSPPFLSSLLPSYEELSAPLCSQCMRPEESVKGTVAPPSLFYAQVACHWLHSPPFRVAAILFLFQVNWNATPRQRVPYIRTRFLRVSCIRTRSHEMAYLHTLQFKGDTLLALTISYGNSMTLGMHVHLEQCLAPCYSQHPLPYNFTMGLYLVLTTSIAYTCSLDAYLGYLLWRDTFLLHLVRSKLEHQCQIILLPFQAYHILST